MGHEWAYIHGASQRLREGMQRAMGPIDMLTKHNLDEGDRRRAEMKRDEERAWAEKNHARSRKEHGDDLAESREYAKQRTAAEAAVAANAVTAKYKADFAAMTDTEKYKRGLLINDKLREAGAEPRKKDEPLEEAEQRAHSKGQDNIVDTAKLNIDHIVGLQKKKAKLWQTMAKDGGQEKALLREKEAGMAIVNDPEAMGVLSKEQQLGLRAFLDPEGTRAANPGVTIAPLAPAAIAQQLGEDHSWIPFAGSKKGAIENQEKFMAPWRAVHQGHLEAEGKAELKHGGSAKDIHSLRLLGEARKFDEDIDASKAVFRTAITGKLLSPIHQKQVLDYNNEKNVFEPTDAEAEAAGAGDKNKKFDPGTTYTPKDLADMEGTAPAAVPVPVPADAGSKFSFDAKNSLGQIFKGNSNETMLQRERFADPIRGYLRTAKQFWWDKNAPDHVPKTEAELWPKGRPQHGGLPAHWFEEPPVVAPEVLPTPAPAGPFPTPPASSWLGRKAGVDTGANQGPPVPVLGQPVAGPITIAPQEEDLGSVPGKEHSINPAYAQPAAQIHPMQVQQRKQALGSIFGTPDETVWKGISEAMMATGKTKEQLAQMSEAAIGGDQAAIAELKRGAAQYQQAGQIPQF